MGICFLLSTLQCRCQFRAPTPLGFVGRARGRELRLQALLLSDETVLLGNETLLLGDQPVLFGRKGLILRGKALFALGEQLFLGREGLARLGQLFTPSLELRTRSFGRLELRLKRLARRGAVPSRLDCLAQSLFGLFQLDPESDERALEIGVLFGLFLLHRVQFCNVFLQHLCALTRRIALFLGLCKLGLERLGLIPKCLGLSPKVSRLTFELLGLLLEFP